MIDRKNLVTTILLLLMAFNPLAFADSGVKMAQNLQNTSEFAKAQGIPILIFFAAEDCPYCERLEGDYLHAMANSLEYKKRIVIRKVVIDSYDDFQDFSGKLVDASDFSDKFNIQIVPTLVFLDYTGQRVTKPMIGYNGSDFFGDELDQAISLATEKIH